jgi:preprotein translocase subunit SecB
MPKAKKQPSRTESDQYREFIRTVHLSGLGIDEAEFKIDRVGFASSFPQSGRASAEITAQYEIVNRKPDSFVVLGHYLVSVKGNAGAELVKIKCTFSALFSLDKEADHPHVERFAQVEARLVFWPYLRHFVADSTYRMSISPLQLPLTSELEGTGSSPKKGAEK